MEKWLYSFTLIDHTRYLIFQVAQLSKFREGGGLGISLEGTVDVENGVEMRPHHYIRAILPDGPVGVNGRLLSSDELLEVGKFVFVSPATNKRKRRYYFSGRSSGLNFSVFSFFCDNGQTVQAPRL